MCTYFINQKISIHVTYTRQNSEHFFFLTYVTSVVGISSRVKQKKNYSYEVFLVIGREVTFTSYSTFGIRPMYRVETTIIFS